MEICVFGANFRTAPMELRERLALSAPEVLKLLRVIRAEGIFQEAVVLSTCNRTELYYAGPEDGALGHMLEHLADVKGVPAARDLSAFYRLEGPAAARHVFRVAASLDSQVVGEPEILGQVKEAYRLAVEAHSARFLMQKLMHRAFAVGKRVRSETALGQGAAGIPQAAVCLAKEALGNLTDRGVLLIGAGGTAERVAAALLRAGAGRLTVANRTLARARQLIKTLLHWQGEKLPFDDSQCNRCPRRRRIACRSGVARPEDCPLREGRGESSPSPLNARAIDMSHLAAAVGGADLVISSTGAPRPVLTAEALGGVLRRRNRPVLMIDIAMPRDIDPALGAFPNVRLCNLDDLEGVVSVNLQKRAAEVPRAEAIVEEEVAGFYRWLQSLDVVPTIQLLRRRTDALVRRELGRYGRKLKGLEQDQLEAFAKSLCKKVLHPPLAFIKGLGEQGGGSSHLESIDLLRRMFDLDSPDGDEGETKTPKGRPQGNIGES
jgi:glutamyl-tRNA reductase